MSGIRVHTVATSPFGRAVTGMLLEKGVQFDICPLAMHAEARHSYLSIHPFGMIPAFEHGSLVLYETEAILRYIDRAFPEPAMTPTDIVAAARMDQLMSISNSYLYPGVNRVIGFQRLVAPRITGRPADEAAIAAAMPAAHRVLGVLEAMLGDQPYLAGDMFSLADVIVAPQVDTLARTPEWGELSANIPRLSGWLGRMAPRPILAGTDWA